MKPKYRIVWTKTRSGPFIDGNIWDNINDAYHHRNGFVSQGWEGYIEEIG